uniref:Cell cycle checkpoint protein RAD1 n=1 Tax=Trichuris muris TaxID=70415 RepID=A0A5S6QPS9_TRIMR
MAFPLDSITLTNGDINSPGHLFKGSTEFTRGIASMIKASIFRETGSIFFTDRGMKVTVEDYKSVQTNVFIPKSLFYQYELLGNCVDLRVKLPVFCECLNLLAGSTSFDGGPRLQLCYERVGSPLRLIIEDGGIVTDCQIKTLRPEDYVEFDFSAADSVCKLIMKPEALRESFLELDSSCEYVDFEIDPLRGFCLSGCGPNGTVSTEIVRNSEVFEIFSCTERNCRKFRISLLKPAVKALQLANKVSLRLNKRGFLAMQFMVSLSGETCFIEFFCAPEEGIEHGS